MRSKRFITFIVILLAVFLGYLGKPADENVKNLSSDVMEVTFLDVGQGDCSVIRLPETDEIIMIDSGEAEQANKIMAFLDENKIDTINYLIGTHPHSDHIGSMAKIVDNYNIENVYMPKAYHGTKTYESLLRAIKNKGIKVIEAKAGLNIIDGNVKAEFVAPVSSGYEELNDYSAVLRLTYNDIAFLFTGDAEKLSENEMLHSSAELSADVLKVGHHGSNTSSSKNFLSAVKPKYAIISADGISYNHPHKQVLKRLENSNLKILKTYELGNITVITDGVNINIETENKVKE